MGTNSGRTQVLSYTYLQPCKPRSLTHGLQDPAPVSILDNIAEVTRDDEVDVQRVDQLGARKEHRHVAHRVDRVRDQHLQPKHTVVNSCEASAVLGI